MPQSTIFPVKKIVQQIPFYVYQLHHDKQYVQFSKVLNLAAVELKMIIDYSQSLSALMLYNTQFVNRMCCILLSANLSVPVLCDIVGK